MMREYAVAYQVKAHEGIFEAWLENFEDAVFFAEAYIKRNGARVQISKFDERYSLSDACEFWEYDRNGLVEHSHAPKKAVA